MSNVFNLIVVNFNKSMIIDNINERDNDVRFGDNEHSSIVQYL